MFDCYQYSDIDNLITKKDSEHLRLVLMFIKNNLDDLDIYSVSAFLKKLNSLTEPEL